MCSLLFEVARLWSNADRHITACVQVAPLDGDPGAAGDGPLRRLDPGEVWSLDKRGDKHKFMSILQFLEIFQGTVLQNNSLNKMPVEKPLLSLWGPYHEGEGPWRQGSIVVDTVPHTHLHLSLLDPVARGVVQQTHYSVDGKFEGLTRRRGEESKRSGWFCCCGESNLFFCNRFTLEWNAIWAKFKKNILMKKFTFARMKSKYYKTKGKNK